MSRSNSKKKHQERNSFGKQRNNNNTNSKVSTLAKRLTSEEESIEYSGAKGYKPAPIMTKPGHKAGVRNRAYN